MARHVLLVLGMHRSGTSSFVGLVDRLGVSIGNDLLEANEWNPRGYGEHRVVVEIHDRFLREIGLQWDSPRAPAPPAFDGPEAERARTAIAALLERDFAGTPCFALKDPRMCRLLPLWKAPLADARVAPRAVFVVRHPVACAASLARRDDMPRGHALLLWAQHVIPALRETAGMKRSFVLYDDLVADWRSVAKRVGAELALDWPTPPEQAGDAIDAFLSPELRHHDAASAWTEEERERLPAWPSLHDALVARAQGEEDTGLEAALGDASAALASATALYGDALDALTGERDRALEAERAQRKAAKRSARKVSQLARSPWLWLRSFVNARLRGRNP